MRHVLHIDFINGDYDIIDPEPPVGRCRAALDELCDVDAGVGADVGVVGAPGYAEPEPLVAPLQVYLQVLPFR